ncbi:MAG: hypothetical protein ACE5I3_13685 [Phycisphaerae bacterium]
MLVVFNPLAEPVSRAISLNLHYAGLTDVGMIREGEGMSTRYELNRRYGVELPIRMPPRAFKWFVIE